MTAMAKRDFLNYVRFRTLLLALDCDDNAEVWVESTTRRTDNGQPELTASTKIAIILSSKQPAPRFRPIVSALLQNGRDAV